MKILLYHLKTLTLNETLNKVGYRYSHITYIILTYLVMVLEGLLLTLMTIISVANAKVL